MNGKHVYSLQAGRIITQDGIPFVAIQRVEPTAPADADDFTREVVRALNSHAELLRACKALIGPTKNISFMAAVGLAREAIKKSDEGK